jgi:uncharacterized membrane protein YcaP (DUF421 family)
MFQMSTSPLEIVVRVVVIYAGLLVALRVVGRKELGQLAPMDFLAMLIVSETVSPALTRQDDSVTAAGVAAVTLLALTFAVDWVTHRWRAAARIVEGEPRVLIEDGRVDREAQRKERISDQDLESALRREGIEHASEAKRAVVEPNGRITVIRRRG